MASDSSQFDVEYLRSWIGREEIGSDLITQDLVRKFNATFDLTAKSPALGDVAPSLIQYCLAQPAVATSALGEDGHPQKGVFLPPVPLPRRMWAGSTLRFRGGLKVGDTVFRTSRIADVVMKEGRSGALCFVTVEHVYDVGGDTRIVEKQDLVYRGSAVGASSQPAPPGDPAPHGEHRLPINVSTPLLFRYSALTFNSHRIHYDRTYATQVEHYPALVVHGPLQATLLLKYATELKGAPPAHFKFRGLAPLFEGDRFHLNATEENGVMTMWTARENGPVAMSAEVSW